LKVVKLISQAYAIPFNLVSQKLLGYSPVMVGENSEVIIGYLRQLVTLEHQQFFFLSGWDIHTSSFVLPQFWVTIFPHSI